LDTSSGTSRSTLRRRQLSVGAIAGLVGGVVIWIYEALVWVGAQHLLPLQGIPSNAVGLVFGKAVQASLGAGAFFLGTLIHFAFAAAWGALFALLWPTLRRRGIEATLAAIGWAVVAWVVMHAAIALVSNNHPDYLDPVVVIGGILSHLFFTVPMALLVRRWLAGSVPGERRIHVRVLDLVDEPGSIAAYERHHAKGGVWPAVLGHMGAQGIESMDIYRSGDRLVMVMGVAADYPRPCVEPPEISEWETLMSTFQRPVPHGRAGEKWTPAQRIFSLDDQ
jgi:L-rhamnose mutarotase